MGVPPEAAASPSTGALCLAPRALGPPRTPRRRRLRQMVSDPGEVSAALLGFGVPGGNGSPRPSSRLCGLASCPSSPAGKHSSSLSLASTASPPDLDLPSLWTPSPQKTRKSKSPAVPRREPVLPPLPPPVAWPTDQIAAAAAEADLERGSGLDTLRQSLLTRPRSSSAAAPAAERVYWESFWVMLPMFMSYAMLFGLQHEVKASLGLSDDKSEASESFGYAVSAMFWCNMIMRFGHRILLGWIPPWHRVFLAMVLPLISMLVIGVVIMRWQVRDIRLVYVAYILGGLGISTFEVSFLSLLTPFGAGTKRAAITAIPVGVNVVLCGVFFVLGPPFSVAPSSTYCGVALAILFGMVVLVMRIPAGPRRAREDSTDVEAVTEVCDVKGRKPSVVMMMGRRSEHSMWTRCAMYALSMCCLTLFNPGVLVYIYDGAVVSLSPGVVLHTPTFFAFVSTCGMVGSVLGRKFGHRLRRRHPATYICASLTGVLLMLLWIPALVPAGSFLVMLSDGLIYESMSSYVDTHYPKQYNSAAISCWLFVGDLGSTLGSSAITPIWTAMQ
eukprot:TRINITY_DN2533_c0_g2_i2.p1 TRINITY_DN2533_c0_g2~~TRINITY_DN2533_c0_g2_i2.p1  ORF type:complete len:557 (-),score=80.39 TRINITY_DN2533_c0_g2_i2:102-1772(-)